jgi:hypothetical protein
MSASGVGQSLEDLEFITELLRIMAQGDAHDDLFWNYRDGQLSFFIKCSDTFAWGTADLEGVAIDEDLAALEQARLDADHLEGGWAWPTLYCARKRKMRPMNRWMQQVVGADNEGDIRLLFEAAGPPRESVFGAP